MMSQVEEQERDLQAKLKNLEGAEWDSDDDEAVAEAATNPEGGSTSKNKGKDKIKKKATGSVLYLGHLPPNFEENEIMAFLKQFGKVLNVRVARSKKTGGSKGYGFVEMQLPKVAAIVAETMSGHIVFGQKRLVCHVVPPEKVHSRLFFQKEPFKRKSPRQKLVLENMKAITSRLVEREQKKRETLKELGIDYDFPGYEGSVKSSETPEKRSKTKKRKDSIASVESEASSTRGRKRKDSIDSSKSQKKRKDSMDSVASLNSKTKSSTPKSKSKKKKRASY